MIEIKKIIKKNSGMTLIELIVVLAILVIVASITITSYLNFKSSVSIKNLADDIALSVRKAQTSAMSSLSSNSSFSYGYGIHFSTNNNTTRPQDGSNRSFVIFYDLSNYGIYDTGSYSETSCGKDSVYECKEIFKITSGDEITGIYINGNLQTPVNGGSNSLDIVFKRPNPEARFCYKASGNNCTMSSDISSVGIEISSPQKGSEPRLVKLITIWNTGQISTN